MACSACAKRRKKLEALKAKKLKSGNRTQAAALGAVLTITEAAGKALGLSEDDSGRGERTAEPDGPADRGDEPNR